MNVAFLPVYPNPYQTLLRDALAANEVSVVMLDGLPSSQWLRDNRDRVQILHYHWLSGLYMNRFLTPLQIVRFINHFRSARALGFRTVWTAHNILPHRPVFPPLDKAIRRLMMKEADAVIAHCEFGRRELLARFPRRGPVTVIAHGHHRDVYPDTISRVDARRRLGLAADKFVYLALGNITAYKGLDELIAVFKKTAGKDDTLIVAGRNRNKRVVSQLTKAAGDDTRIRIRANYIPVEEMQVYFRSADVMVAPFKQVLTSSSVIAGLTFDLPQIVPALGCLPELVTPDAGIVYDPQDSSGLERALVNIKLRDQDPMRAAARDIIDGLNWDTIGHQTANVYRECVGG